MLIWGTFLYEWSDFIQLGYFGCHPLLHQIHLFPVFLFPHLLPLLIVFSLIFFLFTHILIVLFSCSKLTLIPFSSWFPLLPYLPHFFLWHLVDSVTGNFITKIRCGINPDACVIFFFFLLCAATSRSQVSFYNTRVSTGTAKACKDKYLTICIQKVISKQSRITPVSSPEALFWKIPKTY